MQQHIVITTGGLGSDNTIFLTYNIHSHQGMAKVREWAKYLANRQKSGVSAYTLFAWHENKPPFYTLTN